MATCLALLEHGLERVDPLVEQSRNTLTKVWVLAGHLLGQVVQWTAMLTHGGRYPLSEIVQQEHGCLCIHWIEGLWKHDIVYIPDPDRVWCDMLFHGSEDSILELCCLAKFYALKAHHNGIATYTPALGLDAFDASIAAPMVTGSNS